MKSMEPHELPGNIFMQPWWLDIVAPQKWKDIRVEKGNFCKMAYCSKKNKGF